MPADELPRPADRSWWLEEALALPEFAGPEAPALQGDTSADVVILGGGYTGMWTAWFLKEAEPDLDVVLLEQDICGGGPSGRNGGFLNGMYEDLGMLLERFGPEGRRTVEAAARSIEEIGAWCEANGVDAHYGLHGDLAISTAPAFDRQIAEMIEEAEANGVGHLYRALSAEEVRVRFDSPVARIGATMSHTAGVQPARLARGLRRALIERGVRIFEQTPVTRLGVRTAIAETPGGTVRAGHAVLGLNAWSGAIAPLRRSLMVRGTYIVASAPAPERLEQMRWTGGEGVYDLRTSLHYLRTTADGRIVFGGAGHRVAPKRITARYRYDERSVQDLSRDFRRWFPAFDGVPLESAWGGPIDASAMHLPFFGTLRGGIAHYGVGFTGNGVGPCHLGGKILSAMARGREDEYSTLPIARGPTKRFPPEPLYTPGHRLVVRAVIRRDDLMDAGRRVDPITDALAHLPRRLGYGLGP
ncbi:MAG TPA: FAD-binding oxidoreductase [Actinomycetota bacterium]|nr:FAD-binding oxidoreductase [Actinomycetota bacterium]